MNGEEKGEEAVTRKAMGLGFHDGCVSPTLWHTGLKEEVSVEWDYFEVSRVLPSGPCICFHSPLQ